VKNTTEQRNRKIPFQAHYHSENLVAPGIEPGPLEKFGIELYNYDYESKPRLKSKSNHVAILQHESNGFFIIYLLHFYNLLKILKESN
jgi:hypothetical protein